MAVELQDIFCRFGQDFRANNSLPLQYLKTMSSIEFCRTASLGGHVDRCESCDHVNISYNSCRNRHCPKCQNLNRERWLVEREEDLLPIQYFHVVFTLPDLLNPLILRNQKVCYNLLFKAASETLLELADDPKHLGGQIGVTAILHTWGQNLLDHPHLHCVVTGGGLSPDGKLWVSPKKQDFFIHVKVLSRVFKGKFMDFLRDAARQNLFCFPGQIAYLARPNHFQNLVDKLYGMDWVVFCKEPFQSPKFVLEYLGRYTHRVAISNHRIVKVEDGQVTFRWKDNKDEGKSKLMTLEAKEFIRRFLLHVLPLRFVKIRHYGVLSNRNTAKINLCQKLTGVVKLKEAVSAARLGVRELLLKLTGVDISVCPCCGGKMVTRQRLSPNNCSPPLQAKTA